MNKKPLSERDICTKYITPAIISAHWDIQKQIFRGNPEFILTKYVYIFFKFPNFLEAGVNSMTGTAGQQRVPKQYVFNSPLPPIKEQKRIVAKVDQLMELCEELAKGLKSKINIEEKLGSSLLSKTTN